MMSAEAGSSILPNGQPPQFTPQQIGAAVSKLVSASIGDIAVVFSKSPAHKHYAFADLEWMIMPAVLSGQFYVAELEHKEAGARAPVAAVLWARVSNETDARLSTNPERKIKLRPDEWKSGEHIWIVDAAGDAGAIAGSLKQLCETVFKDKVVKIALPDAAKTMRIAHLHDILADAESAGKAGMG